MNGGNCSENGTSFSCQCPDGYTGQRCEIPSKYYFQKRPRCIFFSFHLYSGTNFVELSFMFLWNWVFELRWCNRPSKRLSPLTGFVLVLKSKIQGVIKEFLRLQDTLFGVLRKIATARSKSVRFLSNFHQMFSSACKIW